MEGRRFFTLIQSWASQNVHGVLGSKTATFSATLGLSMSMAWLEESHSHIRKAHMGRTRGGLQAQLSRWDDTRWTTEWPWKEDGSIE